jgi:hypothetical protein
MKPPKSFLTFLYYDYHIKTRTILEIQQMPNQTLVFITDLLMPFTVLSIWWVLLRARNEGPSAAMMALAFVLALVWGAMWSFNPTLNSWRFLPAPAGQAGAILSLIVALNLLRFAPGVSAMFRSIDMKRLVDMGVWRVLYGLALLLIGLQGGLPTEFFWSAAIGDIFVGLWAFAIMARRPNVSRGELIAWNGVGLFDLLHVLALGALFLPKFYSTHPDVPPLNLLPLVGVPLLLVLHIMTLLGQRNATRRQTA